MEKRGREMEREYKPAPFKKEGKDEPEKRIKRRKRGKVKL